MRRLSRWAAGAGVLALLALAGAGIGMRLVASDVAEWHIGPSDATRPDTPNDFLAATPGFTAAEPDLALPPAEDAVGFLAALDRVAMAEPRTERLAGSPDEGRITWVQRSAIMGFPDYVTAEAGPEGRAVWSRARFGRSDFGVNRARVERWLARLAP